MNTIKVSCQLEAGEDLAVTNRTFTLEHVESVKHNEPNWKEANDLLFKIGACAKASETTFRMIERGFTFGNVSNPLYIRTVGGKAYVEMTCTEVGQVARWSGNVLLYCGKSWFVSLTGFVDNSNIREIAESVKRNKKTGEISNANALRFLWKLLGLDGEPSQKELKEWCSAFNTQEYHVYASHWHMPELAQLVNVRTKSTSCMMKTTAIDTMCAVHWAGGTDNLWTRYNKDGEVVEDNLWQHPFRSYEDGEDNRILLVSDRELKDGETFSYKDIPFVARAISYDWKWVRSYGSERGANVLEACDKLRNDYDLEGMTVRIYEPERRTMGALAPYVDGDAQIGNVQQNEYAEDNHYRRACEEVTISYSVESGDDWTLDGVGGATKAEWSVTCRITGESIRRDEAVWIERLGDYVEERYAIYNKHTDRWDLDGYEILRYFE